MKRSSFLTKFFGISSASVLFPLLSSNAESKYPFIQKHTMNLHTRYVIYVAKNAFYGIIYNKPIEQKDLEYFKEVSKSFWKADTLPERGLIGMAHFYTDLNGNPTLISLNGTEGVIAHYNTNYFNIKES